MTSTRWRAIKEKCPANKRLCERLDNIEYFDEIYNCHCLNWFEKLANMPATESEIRLPQKLLGAWCYNCSRIRGGSRKNTCNTYLNLLNSLKFDASNPILGRNRGELSCIFALITGDRIELKLTSWPCGLHELVKDWQLGSIAPASVN